MSAKRFVRRMISLRAPGGRRAGRIRLFAMLAVLAGGVAATETGLVEGIRMPIRRHANGRTQTLLTAHRARLTGAKGETGAFEGGIRLYFFTETGETNGVIEAERLLFEQTNGVRTAHCPGPVSAVFDGVQLSGTHLIWNEQNTYLTIETNAVLVLDREGRSLVEGMN